MLRIIPSDESSKKPEDASYTLDVLAKCMVSREGGAKKTTKIVPLKDPGVPVVVSVPLSQVDHLYCFCLILLYMLSLS